MAYVVTGILLGMAVMVLPLGQLPVVGRFIGLSGCATPLCGGEVPGCTFGTEKNVEFGGVLTFPSSFLYAGLMLAFSLVFALGVHLLFKRRMRS